MRNNNSIGVIKKKVLPTYPYQVQVKSSLYLNSFVKFNSIWRKSTCFQSEDFYFQNFRMYKPS